jgi:hypothetical protein
MEISSGRLYTISDLTRSNCEKCNYIYALWQAAFFWLGLNLYVIFRSTFLPIEKP